MPLFVTGRLASLRLGPSAGNLAGARAGAERIAWSIEDILGRRGEIGVVTDEERRLEFHTGRGNRYDSLVGGLADTEVAEAE